MSQGTLIGTGESSEVVLRNDTTVIKKFKKRNFFNDELKILKMLDKNNVPRTVKMISFDKDNEHIMLPYIPYNLEKIIIGESKKKLADLNIVMVIQELLLCLQDLHKNNIIHGDYKAKNVQINKSLKPIVIDFGLSCVNFDNDDCEKQKMGDLMKMWFIIIQLLLGIDYKTSYQKKKGNIKKIKKDLPDLIDLYDEKNNNISDIIDFFHEKDNIKKINNMISKQ